MSAGSIPCTENNIRVKYSNFKNLIPPWRKGDNNEPNILAAGGELCDPWFEEAEREIVRDLRKFSTPVTLSDFSNLSDLTQLKAYKVLELLFRTNFKDEGDKFQIEADRYAAKYASELESLPVITPDGANYSLGGGITRTS